jgi:hypothetical protein
MSELDIDDPLYVAPSEEKPKRRREPFLQIPISAIAAGGGAVRGAKQLIVWLYIHHRVWADLKDTVLIGNPTLKEWGVDRQTKYKALKALEFAGLIAVQWRPNRSPLVTLRSK